LGKLVSGSLNSFYGLVAVLPLLAVPILMGGISAGQFIRMGLACSVAVAHRSRAGA